MYSPRHREGALAEYPGLQVGAAQELVCGLLDMLGLAFLDDQQRPLAGGESHEFLFDQGVGGIEHVQGQSRDAESVGQAQVFQGPQDAVVQAALEHDSKIAFRTVDEFVELVVPDEAHRRGPALIGLLAFLLVGVGRQDDARRVALRRIERVSGRVRRTAVVAGDESPVQMAGADAQHQHYRRIAGLGKLEALLHGGHYAVQPGFWIEQPELRFHREGVRAFLHDAGALAVVLAQNNERAALDPRRSEVAERVAGHVGTHGGLPGHRAAQGVVDGSRQRGSGGGFAGAGLEAHAQLVQDLAGVSQHVHQVRDRRALVAGHVGHARLQQRLGDREYALAAEFLARGQPQQFNFLRE